MWNWDWERGKRESWEEGMRDRSRGAMLVLVCFRALSLFEGDIGKVWTGSRAGLGRLSHLYTIGEKW